MLYGGGAYFQSHYGLILSRGSYSNLHKLPVLSIPLWSDFILEHRIGSGTNPQSSLSIPLWSDFIAVVDAGRIHVLFPFNPTMVWFYRQSGLWFTATRTQLSIPLWSDFIARIITCISEWKTCFQSHYGLILSLSSMIKDIMSSITFNPTMVWFYQGPKPSWRARPGWLSIPLWSDFIVTLPYMLLRQRNTFQSHYGLILSRDSHDNRVLKTSLSIPLWSDFIIKEYGDRLVKEKIFQSHYGLILSSKHFYIVCCTIVSFNPTMVWFYLLTSAWRARGSTRYTFQSHYGLILSVEDPVKRVMRKVADFQSHYGLILSSECVEKFTLITVCKSIFQSHYGLILSVEV